MNLLEQEFNDIKNFSWNRVLKDITNSNQNKYDTLTKENEEIKCNIDNQYLQTRKSLLKAEENGANVSMSIFHELEDLK